MQEPRAQAIEEASTPEHSFVQVDMRKAAMKLHTRDQAKEGEQKAQAPFTAWQPTRQDYLKFLIDSKHVYETMEKICNRFDQLKAFRNTGLERSDALAKDIKWMCENDKTLTVVPVGSAGQTYAQFLEQTADQSVPKFVCHYYNHYFAHTAGGRMIGKKVSEMLLDNYTLNFYQWDGDLKQLLDQVRKDIDALACTWSEQEKQDCLDETASTFKFGGSLLSYLTNTQH